MRALSFRVDNRASYGIELADGVHEASVGFRERYKDLRAVLDGGALGDLDGQVEAAGIDPARIEYLPTIPNPDKVICVGVNYRPHIEEMGREVPEYPVLFVRFSGSLVGHGQPLVHPGVSGQYDFEGEIAVVIGQRARRVSREQALGVVAGYVPFMDGSVRDWQRHTIQFTAGKNFARSGAVGPCLVTPDELGDLAELGVETRLNGETMQSGRLDELVFDLPYLIEYITTFTEQLPGDIVATGTPGGVGAARNPPVWLCSGDRLEVDLGEAGCLVNTVQSNASY